MNYNKNGLIVLLTCIFISISWFIYIVYFTPPIVLAQLESDSSQDLLEDIDFSTIKKPWISSKILITHGTQVFKVHCASCHGKTGKGDGLLSAGLTPPPRNLIKGDWKQGGGSVDIYKTLVNGIKDTSMISFTYLSSVDRWALVHYVRFITKNKVIDNKQKLEAFSKTAK